MAVSISGGLRIGLSGGRRTARISFSGSIEEGATTGRAVGTATLANPPEDIGTLTWSELGTGTGAALFAINSSTGAVTNTAAIDYETATSYTYGIQVTDGVYTYTLMATISVTDVDEVAPTLSSPTDAANGATAANISVSTDEANGTLYWYISTSATPPSAADLKAGTGAVTSGNQAVTATGIQSASASGLTAETAYYTYFLHRDAAGNDSSIAAADGFTTAASGGGSTAGEPMGLLLALLKAA